MKTKVLSIENKTEHLGRHVWENDDLHLVDTIIEMFQFGICPDNKLWKKILTCGYPVKLTRIFS